MMKKKMIIIIGTILCIVMVLAFAACGENTSAENSSETTVASNDEISNSDTESDTKATGKTVYFAGPLFSQAERDYNLKITKVLEDNGYQVFLPQRDGFLASELEGKTEEEKARTPRLR